MSQQRSVALWVPTAVMLSVIAISGCSTVLVSQDYQPGTNFSNLSAYDWRIRKKDNKSDAVKTDPFTEERIRNAVERVLLSKGFRKIPAGTLPDFLIDFRYTFRLEYNYEDVRTGLGWGYRPYGGLGYGRGYDVYTRKVGLLVIDFIDPKSGNIIWRGKGTHEVDEHWKPETKTGKINTLVSKILVQFPPNHPQA